MTRTDLLRELRALERLFEDRITIVRVILDGDGTEVGRVSRVVLNAPRGSAPPQKKEQPR